MGLINGLIKELREAAGLDAADLARDTGISEVLYKKYENGDPGVSVGALYSISRRLGIDATVLLNGAQPWMETKIICRNNGEILVERPQGGKEQQGKQPKEAAGETVRGKPEEKKKEYWPPSREELPSIPQKRILEWRQSYSMRIDFFDNAHKDLVKLINQLYTANTASSKDYMRDVFMRTIRWAIKYAQNLRNEEKIMEQVNYPTRGAHKREHVLFIKEVLEQARAFQSNKTNNTGSFVLFLKDWVQSHVGIYDKDLGAYLMRLKREGNLKNIIIRIKRNTDERVIIA
jgi:hemerythrin